MTRINAAKMDRIIIPMPAELLRLLDGLKPEAQSRAEWIREAIRRRIVQDGPKPN